MNFALRARRATAIGLTLAVAAVGLTFTPLSAAPAEAASNATNTAKVLKEINSARKSSGLPQLRANGYVAARAKDFATKIAKKGSIYGVESSKPVPNDPSTGAQPEQITLTSYVYGNVSESKKIAKLISGFKNASQIKNYNFGSLTVIKKNSNFYAALTLVQYGATPENLLTLNQPTITGAARYGQTLTAKRVSSPSASVSYSYQWKVGGETIPTNSSKLKLGDTSQIGKKVTVTVTATRSGYTTVSKTSKAVTIGKGKFATKTPVVNGKRVVGKTLQAGLPKWSAGATYSYQWLRNGKTIKGATSKTYKLVYADKKKKIDVKVKAVKAGYTTAYKTSHTSTKTKAK